MQNGTAAVVGFVGVAAVAALVWWFTVGSDSAGPVDTPDRTTPDTIPTPPITPTLSPTTPPGPRAGGTLDNALPAQPEPLLPPEVPLPELNASDPLVRETFADIWPESWLQVDDLVRRGAVLIDNAARGDYPRRQLGFLAPAGKFPVTRDGERVFMDAAGYARYNRYLKLLEGLPPERLAELLVDWQPLFGQAFDELGNRRGMFAQVHEAIAVVERTPLLSEPVELLQPNVLFEYADLALEALTPLQKQMLRMGADNVKRLQAYAAAVKQALLASGPEDS